MENLVKRVILDGNLVLNVEVVPAGSPGLIIRDDCWVEAGCTWNGDEVNPVFTPPPAEPDNNDFSFLSV